MKTFKKDTTLVGVSELRTNFDKILKEARDHKVIVSRRDEELAVIMDIGRYNAIEKILDELEDFALGYMAKERKETAKISEYIDLDGLEKAIVK